MNEIVICSNGTHRETIVFYNKKPVRNCVSVIFEQDKCKKKTLLQIIYRDKTLKEYPFSVKLKKNRIDFSYKLDVNDKDLINTKIRVFVKEDLTTVLELA